MKTRKSLENNSSRSNPIWLVAAIVFLLALSVRLAFLKWHGVLLTPDSKDYLTLAHNLIFNGVFSLDTASPFKPTIRWPPLYPAFIGALSWTGGSSMVIAGAQAVIDSATAVILMLMLRACVSLRCAALGSLAYAIHPGAVVSVHTVLTETLFTFLLVLSIYTLSQGFEKNKKWKTALSGLILGLSILCRPIALMLPVVLLIPMLMFPPRRRAVKHWVLMLVIAFLIVAPWSIRSSIVAGRLVTVQDSAVLAILFYVATRFDWDQKDQAKLWPAVGEETKRMVSAAVTNHESGSNSPQRIDQMLIREGIKNIRANPGKYLASRAKSFPYLVITSYDSATGINQSFGTALAQRDFLKLGIKVLLLILFSLIPLGLGVLGLAASRRNLVAALGATVWLYALIFYIPLWVEPRYWTPFVPFLLVSSALGASSLWHRFHKGSQNRTT